MELIQLLYFMEVAKYENMTLAAKENHISQQALSKSIRKLEQELGAELFDRRNHRLSLNASGKLALEQIQDILTGIETLKKTVGRVSSPQELVIGSSSLISIRTLILNFNNAYPNFLISTNSIPEDHLFEKLQRRQIDVAISVQKYPPPQIQTYVPSRFFRKHFCLLFPVVIRSPKKTPSAYRN